MGDIAIGPEKLPGPAVQTDEDVLAFTQQREQFPAVSCVSDLCHGQSGGCERGGGFAG
ncbi:hypothetical protein HO173_004725 [Letharia columbiana]|uniref:Uncharacterized protein n=1 Tax=Letharia columbiana TaxID=112416 RepID=A0A8H6L6F5_9LECA|nr:uncharacterized protein HO173_004725 [Letharia columbiana]KAF6237256.1 hypothetical protein HO173_004725 [Letharia columbiana]